MDLVNEITPANMQSIQPSILQSISIINSKREIRQRFVNSACIGITANTLIHMIDGTYKPVNQINKDDIVFSTSNLPSKIKCIVKLRIYNDIDITSLSNHCSLASNNLIYLDNDELNNWKPANEFTSATYGHYPNEYLYNIILDNNHVINIFGGINIATLGNPINIKYDSLQIINDLMDHPNYNDGLITLESWQFIQNPRTTRFYRLEY